MDRLIDVDSLRQDLIDYFGTAAMGNPLAYVDLVAVSKAGDQQLVETAIKNGFNLADYEVKGRSR